MNYTLMAHQASALNKKAAVYPKYAFFHDTGTGKTLLGIEIIKLYMVRTLIVCLLSNIEGVWMEELKLFAPTLYSSTINLWTLGQKCKSKMGAMQFKMGLKNCIICIVNFESFKTYRKEIEKENFKLLIIDESSKIKNIMRSSSAATAPITVQLINYSLKYSEYVYEFSGNPAPNSQLEYYSQMRILSSDIFGTSFYSFRAKYFYRGEDQYKWFMHSSMEQEFNERLSKYSEVVMKEDVLDLPKRTDCIRDVYLSEKELRAYKKMEKTFRVEFENVNYTAPTSAVKIMKLRQIANGFIMKTGENYIIAQSKLKVLLELLEEIGNHQAIIWTQFHIEADVIMKALADKKTGRIDGTIKQEIKDKQIEKFKNGGLQYVIAHPRSMGHGHRFINCHYSIHHSFSYSYDEFKQAPDRIHRKGQVHECTMYWLIAKGTYDKVIYNCAKTKGDIVKATFDFIKERNTI